MKTIKMTFNDYVDTINRNNLFDLIDDLNKTITYYRDIIGKEFQPDLASVEVTPSQSKIVISIPGNADFVSRSVLYGFKNFSI